MKPRRADKQSIPDSGTTRPETSPANSPAGFPERILLCVAGLSPQVITETLYALATRNDKFIPTEIHVITTVEGAERVRLTLLGDDPQERHFYRLCTDLDIDPQHIHFDNDTIHQLGRQTDKDSLLEDIRTVKDNEIAADNITAIVRDLTADPQAAIHASIAGGRKTMGFYLGYAMSLFGREQDRLSHVLVSPSFESHNEFYYPPKQPKVLRDRNNRPIHTRQAGITLADIPFVRLRGHLDRGILGGNMSYSETVSRTQRNVDPPRLIIDCARKQLNCGGHVVTLSPNLFAFYCWFAYRLLAGKPGIHWSQDNAAEEYLDEYARIVGEFSADYEAACESLRHGMDPSFFEPKLSKVNKELEKALGKEPSKPYLVSKIGVIPDSRRELKGLTLKKEQIQLLEG